MQIRRVLLIFLVCGMGSPPVFSQSVAPSPFYYAGKEIWFDHRVGIRNTGLVNGQEYHMPFQSTFTHPFFESRESSLGDVVCGHQLFKEIPLMYDVYQDQLVYKQMKANGLYDLIQLDRENIQEFSLMLHTFRKLMMPGAQRGEEFFDILFEGNNTSLVVKRKKTDKINESRRKLEYVVADQPYLVRGGQWTMLNNKKSIYRMAEKKSVRHFLKLNRIKVNQLKDKDLIKTAAFLDQSPALPAKP